MAFSPGDTFGGFTIDGLLGAGGMGEVYRAHEHALGRKVALKIVSPDGADDPATRARFVREARAAASVHHPNVVTIYSAGEIDGVAFVAMELLDGATLRTARHGATLAQRLGWTLDLARALHAVHAAGLVHRDVKPDNVIVANGAVKLLDFGIAKHDPMNAPTTTLDGAPSYATVTGSVIGTPRYMAPEQSRGAPLDARVDQFAWGLLAYEILGGEHPTARSPGFSANADFAAPPTALATVAPDLPFGVSAIVMRALARFPHERFESMSEIIAALEPLVAAPAREITAPTTPSSTPRSGVTSIAFLLGLLVVIALAGVAIAAIRTLRDGRPPPIVASAVPSVIESAPVPEPSAIDSAAPPASTTAARVAPRVSKRCSCHYPGNTGGLAYNLCASPDPECTCTKGKDFGGLPRAMCPVPWAGGKCPSGVHSIRGASHHTGEACDGYPEQGDGATKETGGVLACTSCSSKDIYAGVPGAPCRGIDDHDGQMRAGTWRCTDTP